MMTLIPGKTYLVKQDNKPFRKGDRVRYIKMEVEVVDKGWSDTYYYFYNEKTKKQEKMMHSDPPTSAPLHQIFEVID